MNNRVRLITAIAALMLVILYFVPIWDISLEAPQYPEGIGLYIWLHTISGHNQHDLANINRLNHYIGMKEIHPESIPELTLMPYLVAFLIIFGLVAAIVKKPVLLYIWLIIFVGLLITGMVDFYLWEYDYGHNLNPEAAIKVPGMTYQPPLIGSKQLLNMRTTSLPHIGGWTAALSILLGIYGVYLIRRQKGAAA